MDAVSLALGEVDETDMLKGKAESLKSLYSVLFNQFTKDKTLAENADLLERIADEYKDITGDILVINESLSDFQKAIQNMSAKTADYTRQYEQIGMTEEEKALDDLRRDYEELIETYKLTGNALMQANFQYYRQVYMLKTLQAAQKKYDDGLEAEKKRKEAIEKAQKAIESAQQTLAGARADNARTAFASTLSGPDYENDYALAIYDAQQTVRAYVEDLVKQGVAVDEATTLGREYYAELRKGAEATRDAAKAEAELADEAARIAANLSRLSGLSKVASSVASFRSGISPRTYSGTYASADQWKDSQMSGLRKLQQEMFDAGYAVQDINTQTRELVAQINDEYEAKKKEIDASNEAAEALKKVQTWSEIGNRALNSTGTLGSVVQQFTDGEGDFWSDIVNALLTIMENTEGWGDIAATLDQIFEMFEPVVDAFINLIVALPWDEIIKALKIVAAAIVIIVEVVRGIIEVFKWLWHNLKAVLNNIWEAITHPFGGGSYQDVWGVDVLAKKLGEVAADTVEELEKIRGVNEEIERNTNKDDTLKVLEELRSRGIINEQQFNEGLRVVQKDMVFDPVHIRDSQYIAGNGVQPTAVTYGDFTINIEGTSNPEETIRILLRKLNEFGIFTNAEIGAY